MKKYLLLALGAVLFTSLAQAKDLPELSNTIERAIAKQTLPFANGRVKQMCEEWPTCQEWVNNKIQQNPSFQIVDAEVERWLSKWNGDKAIWKYRFYVQTQENGQAKAYRFSGAEQEDSSATPVLIKKFPGHPGQLSEHISVPDIHLNDMAVHQLCDSWPGYTQWRQTQNGYVNAAVASQYVYKLDGQGNALWKKRLYVRINSSFDSSKTVYFQAHQLEHEGNFTYQAPVEMGKFPHRAAF